MLLEHKFVEFIPEKVKEGLLYISIEYCTAIHKCVCGCGNEVVTPLSPTEWELKFNGKSITLHPSMGNWNFECRSHYWIRSSKIEFAGCWSKKEILKGRAEDLNAKKFFYNNERNEVKDALIRLIKTGFINQAFAFIKKLINFILKNKEI
ncbi:DUF6527 family protein [Edaphocola flava]|uniref:DUF6527 family protein n=1 Tax=Edaphocola flava TaxID=2499629 RepID=UPI00192A63F6|nr:DUF6527 family protein [Edaphocola flava]